MNRIKLWVINLEGQIGQRRRQETIREFSEHHLNIEIFPAVFGKEIIIDSTTVETMKLLQYQQLITLYDTTKRLNKRSMTIGELGCAWSHQLLYSKLINDEEAEAYFIFEDDIQFYVSFDKFIDYLINLPPLDSFDVCTYAKDIDWFPLEFTKTINKYYTHITRRFFSMACSYIITKRGAAHLLDYCKHQVNIPADDLLSNSFVNNCSIVIAPLEPLFQIRKELGEQSNIDLMNQNEQIQRSG